MKTPTRIDLRIDDVDEAQAFLTRTYGSRLLVNRPGPAAFGLELSRVDAGRFASTAAALPGVTRYRMLGHDDVLINTLVDGAFEADRGTHVDRYVAGDLFIGSHGGAGHACRTQDIRARTMSVSRALLSEIAGGEPRFVSFTPRAGEGRRWSLATRFVDDLLADPPSAAAPLVLGSAARLLATTALAVFPNTAVSEPAAEDRRDARPETLRRAIAYIESNPELDIGTAEIARAAHVTPRAIQLAFRRHLDTTPTAYLRRVRLQHAHQQLLDGTPDGLTVTDVALRWGFATPSRFARQYRIAYGRTPSATLRG